MDWGATAALAAIAWTNGVQRVPAGAVVLRRVLGGPWAPLAVDVRRTRWQVVGWWAPLTASLVLRAGATGAPLTVAWARRLERRVEARLRRARPFVRALRVMGALELASLVFGVPWGATRFGVWGLAGGVAAVLLLATITAATALLALRRTGVAWKTAARAALRLLSPFGAPRAADVLLERVVRDAPPELVARAVLPREAFASFIRPRAFDATRAARPATGEDGGRVLRTMIGAEFLAAVVAAPPLERRDGEAYCPRCAALYDAGVRACGDCDGVALVP